MDDYGNDCAGLREQLAQAEAALEQLRTVAVANGATSAATATGVEIARAFITALGVFTATSVALARAEQAEAALVRCQLDLAESETAFRREAARAVLAAAELAVLRAALEE